MSAEVATSPTSAHDLSKVDSAIDGENKFSQLKIGADPTTESVSKFNDLKSHADSAIEEGDHLGEIKPARRRTSSTVTGVFSINELEKENVDLAVAPETQKLNWKINTSPNTIDDREYLQKLLITPPVKKMDLRFHLGLVVTARNLKGVTIKDACDAIYKQYKKKSDDELTEGAYLKGFEWDREENYTSLLIHTKQNADVQPSSGKRKKSRSGSVAEPVPE